MVTAATRRVSRVAGTPGAGAVARSDTGVGINAVAGADMIGRGREKMMGANAGAPHGGEGDRVSLAWMTASEGPSSVRGTFLRAGVALEYGGDVYRKGE